MDFYRAQWARLVAALTWSLPPGEEAEDVAQEAFARAYERWSRVRVHARPDAWLFLTAYRLRRSLWRRAVVRNRHLPDQRMTSDDLFEGISARALLDTLPPRHRAAILLRHHYGLSTRETARVLGCAEGTVKSALSRARQAVRAAMQESEQSEREP